MRQSLRASGPVTMKQHDFLAMMRRLARQSENRREAGAFLLGPTGGRGPRRNEVTAVEYYVDLDPDSLTGGITFHASGYTRLNQTCRERGLRAVADIHLHPGRGARQSPTDAAHPMVARPGHVALIAPNYGFGVTSADQLGVNIKTSTGWHSLSDADIESVFHVRTTARGTLMRIWANMRSQGRGVT